ncbi:nitroreductase [Endozoicomonas sp. Mp262]|uniref:nitroreductase family protein n=1 Tax=Endozoicomonas sp. Mp262 TaxID=2919499 RepID=UPI0021D8B5E5
MDIKEALVDRVSNPALTEPGPTEKQLELIFKAALRAPDHGRLRPWRFITIKGDARNRLGDLFAEAVLSDQKDLSEDALNRYRGMPLRAPVLIALVCKARQHPKIPEIEQQLSLGAAAQNILHGAYAQGMGAMWRTGAISYHPMVASGLGLEANEQLLGFIYLGTPYGARKKRPELSIDDFVSAWE